MKRQRKRWGEKLGNGSGLGTAMYTDVRVIDMHRQPKPVNIALLKDSVDWLTLGHFNQFSIEEVKMETAPDDTTVDLSRIYQHNQELSRRSIDTYNQPVYLLQEFPLQKRKKVNTFWNLSAAFLLVTRVHAAQIGQQEFEETINTYLKSKDRDDRLQPISYDCTPVCKAPVGSKVIYMFYRTLEFSDVILVAKSDSLETLMKVVGRLYSLPNVGDSYTYIGISPSELSENQKHRAHKRDLIPYVLMRFAVKDARAAEGFFKAFKKKLLPEIEDKFSGPLLITGTEDLKLLIQDVSSQSLCHILRNMLPGVDPSTSVKVNAFWAAFDDMTTRLSIDEKPLFQSPDVPKSSSSELYGIYNKLYERVHQLYNMAGNRYPDWLRPTTELVKLMRSFSGNCIFYQVCFTVLDGVKGLVRLCEKAITLDQSDPANKAILDMLHMTLTGISDLMEHMIRMEGELVHHPETRPILYDIPANLLELYLHFSESCMLYFCERESPEAVQRCRLLVIPCLCSTIKIRNITDYRDEEPPLLYVEVPLHLLYDSKYVICSLVHEVAHFSGELTRMRESRFKGFVLGIASQMAAYLELSDSQEVISSLAEKIKCLVPLAKRTHMDELQREVIKAIDIICEDAQFIYNLTFEFFSSIGQAPDWETKYVKAIQTSLSVKTRNLIYQNVEELVYLYREAYADLAMISLLALSIEDYLCMVKADIRIENDTILPLAVERAAVVVRTINKEWANDANCTDLFGRTVRDYLLWMDHHENNISFKIPVHSFQAVGSVALYLEGCYSSMCRCDQRQENKESLCRIRNEFNNFAGKQRFASVEFYEALEFHRKRLLQSSLI